MWLIWQCSYPEMFSIKCVTKDHAFVMQRLLAQSPASRIKPQAHPVLTSQAEVPCFSIFCASMAAYFMGCHIRKAPPKHALKVASGSVTPISVPATCTTRHTRISSGLTHATFADPELSHSSKVFDVDVNVHQRLRAATSKSVRIPQHSMYCIILSISIKRSTLPSLHCSTAVNGS